MKAKLKVWVVFDNHVKFGDGRAELLELIDELGSIKQAVARVGMSYRNAWGYLRDLERPATGTAFQELEPGSREREGSFWPATGSFALGRMRSLLAASPRLSRGRADEGLSAALTMFHKAYRNKWPSRADAEEEGERRIR